MTTFIIAIVFIIFVFLNIFFFRLCGSKFTSERRDRLFQFLWKPYYIHCGAVRKLRYEIRYGLIKGIKRNFIERIVLWVLALYSFISLFNTFLRWILFIPFWFSFLVTRRIFPKIESKIKHIRENRVDGVSKVNRVNRVKKLLHVLYKMHDVTENIRKNHYYQTDISEISLIIILVAFHFWFYSQAYSSSQRLATNIVNSVIEVIIYWRLLGLLIYHPAMVFFVRYKIYKDPVSLNRSLILLFIDYVQIILCFSILYICRPSIGISECKIILKCPLKSLYFSAVTITTLGDVNFSPINVYGRFLVSSEVLMGFYFVILIFGDFLQRSSIAFRRQ